MTVDYRLVQVRRRVNGETVVQKGLRPGEKVVTGGQLLLSQGAAVKIVESVQG